MKVIDCQAKEQKDRITCSFCGQSVFVEVVINPRRDKNGEWDRRTGVRRLRCVNSCKRNS